ncbi:hypothetical protein HZH68_007551 [Vespula germanica]|uniref:Uncharacterized protein n=1 Tax=Vespula germanica TaxID=30212 RepID=A0A834KD70_VESGE|nr:hypothetical protein HZH68_007551 [Vespula germanica]
MAGKAEEHAVLLKSTIVLTEFFSEFMYDILSFSLEESVGRVVVEHEVAWPKTPKGIALVSDGDVGVGKMVASPARGDFRARYFVMAKFTLAICIEKRAESKRGEVKEGTTKFSADGGGGGGGGGSSGSGGSRTRDVDKLA